MVDRQHFGAAESCLAARAATTTLSERRAVRTCSFLSRRGTTRLAIAATAGLLIPVAIAVVPALAQEEPTQESQEVVSIDDLPALPASELPASTLPSLFAFFAVGDGDRSAEADAASDGESVDGDSDRDDVTAAGPPAVFPALGLLPADLLAVAARSADERAMVWLLAADENSQLADWAGAQQRVAAFERAQANYQRALENYRAAKERAKQQRDDAVQRPDEGLQDALTKRERALERRSVRLAELQQRFIRPAGPPDGAGRGAGGPSGRSEVNEASRPRSDGPPGLVGRDLSGPPSQTGPPSDFPGGVGAGRGNRAGA